MLVKLGIFDRNGSVSDITTYCLKRHNRALHVFMHIIQKELAPSGRKFWWIG